MRVPPLTAINSGSGIGSQRATVATAGTPVQLIDSPPTLGVTVRALLDNTGPIFVGGSDVSPATGFELAPGEAMSLDVGNCSLIYVDAADDGDGVCVAWVKA